MRLPPPVLSAHCGLTNGQNQLLPRPTPDRRLRPDRGAVRTGQRRATPMRILHISADYPDPLVPSKTRAVEALLGAVPEHEHRVWSLNRVGWRYEVSALSFGAGHRAVAYGAPSRGLGLATRLRRVAEFVLNDSAAVGFRPDIVHAHKLSVEGLVGETVADALRLPLVITSQGNSDLKILGIRRDLRPRWRRIWQSADVVFVFAPWTRDWLNAALGRRDAVHLLPCIVREERLLAPTENNGLIRTAFHLQGYQNKNALRLMRATVAAARRMPALRLEIAGGGDAQAFAHLSRAARLLDPARLSLVGQRSAAAISSFFNGAACMALPSRRESFGMVFVEALMAGCPVLLPRGWAIDGYLEDGEVGVAVPPGDETAIAAGLERLAREEVAFKRRLRHLHETGGLDLFRAETIAATYRAGLNEALNRRHGAPDHVADAAEQRAREGR